MPQTDTHIGRTVIDAVVPERFAEYRPLVADALDFFVRRLSPARFNQIVTEQVALGPNTPASTRMVALLHASPTLHKLGQVVARHRALDESFRRQLQTLEMSEPRTAMDLIRPVVERELGAAIARHSIELEAEALAEASVAVVVPFDWSPRGDDRRERGVFKVLRPGVAAQLREELAILAELADYLDARQHDGLPRIAYRETFDSVRAILGSEVHFECEQANLTEAMSLYDGRRDVLVPRLLGLSTPRLTALERVDGSKVTDVDPHATGLRRTLATAMIDALVCTPGFSRMESVLFHADPHAGNLFATTDGRLALFDWSLTGRLSKTVRVQMAQIVLAALTLDVQAVVDAVRTLSQRPAEEAVLVHEVGLALRAVRKGSLPGPRWIIELMDRLVQAGCTFPADLLLFRKTLLMLEGVAADLSSDCTLDSVVVAAVVRTFAEEWPRRALALPYARDFATHLSNADLLRFSSSGPMTMMNFWTQTWREWLAGR